MKTKIYKITTGIAGGYHVLIAAAGLLLPPHLMAKVAEMAFGITFEMDPQLSVLAKFTSVYMLAFGVALIFLSRNPIKYRAFTWPALILFAIRFVTRVFFFSTLATAGMPASRNISGAVLILGFFLALLITMPKSDSEEGSDESAADTA